MNNIKILPRYRVDEINKKVISEKCKNNKRKTTEQYKEELKDINLNIEVLEEYINATTKILHRFKKCGHKILISPTNVLNGSGCVLCRNINLGKNNDTKTHEQFLNEIKLINPYIKINGLYKNAREKIEAECLICGHIWNVFPYSLLRGSGCFACARKKNGLKLRKTHEEFVNDLRTINPNINIIGKYKSALEPIDCSCIICNYIWSPIANALLRGYGCPKCNISRGERRVISFLTQNYIKYIYQKRFVDLKGIGGKKLSYDFYLPNYNLLIEFQGEQHEKAHGGIFGGEEQFKKQQEHDRRKREYAKQNSINLLEIWYYDFNNIESILLQKINEIKENNLKLESVETVMVV